MKGKQCFIIMNQESLLYSVFTGKNVCASMFKNNHIRPDAGLSEGQSEIKHGIMMHLRIIYGSSTVVVPSASFRPFQTLTRLAEQMPSWSRKGSAHLVEAPQKPSTAMGSGIGNISLA